MQLAHPTVSIDSAAHALTRDLPRDQALGLRLMALASAAAALHMGRAVLGTNDHPAQEPADHRQLLRSQASALLSSPLPTPHSRLPSP